MIPRSDLFRSLNVTSVVDIKCSLLINLSIVNHMGQVKFDDSYNKTLVLDNNT